MLTKEQCVAATHGTIFYHVSMRNARGTPLRVRVTGKCKTWVRSPWKFRLPVCHGLRDHGEINEHNAEDWCITEAAAVVEGP